MHPNGGVHRSASAQPKRFGGSGAADTAVKPALSREVFRLIVRLEEQKTLHVDVCALEKKFHVPSGFSDEDGHVRQEYLAQHSLPGPGAYEIPVSWIQSKSQSCQGSASFLSPSRCLRKDSKGSTRLDSKGFKREIRKQSDVADRHLKHSPSAIFTRSDRGLLSPPNRSSAKQEEQSDAGTPSWLEPSPVVFCRSSRGLDCNDPRVDERLSPASYQVKRLWDPSPKTGVSRIDVPCPAVFGASREQRSITWTPSLTPPTHAVPDAWDSSRHYAKHKSKVVKQKHDMQRVVLRHHSSATTINSKRAIAAQELPTHFGIPHHDDPFEWLRHERHGEQRVHLLTSKLSLADHFSHLAPCEPPDEDLPAEKLASIVARHQSLPELRASDLDDDDIHRESEYVSADITPVDWIIVSCRLPGGLILAVRIYSDKLLRHLKSSILRRQKRFQSEDQFDLYLQNGIKLGGLDETLRLSGIHDRSLVQVVPTMALTPLKEPSTSRQT